MVPPIAEKRRAYATLHGDVRADDYQWLRNRDDPAVIEYLQEENEHTEATMAHTSALQTKLYSEMLSRIKEDDTTVPYPKFAYWY